ncbi:hypothetical protein [Hyphobacterium sp.]|uniref:hypothetical protein n=1 Tax=Hyphobacterium sp. TaxID=2004662 RepID=UPI003BAA042B
MGWVRFLLAAAAFPAIVAGIWIVLPSATPDTGDNAVPVYLAEPVGSCSALQGVSVDLARTAQRDLEAQPALALATASDALIAAELARAVCEPAEWADPKILSIPAALQHEAYQRLSTGGISDFHSACESLEAGILNTEESRRLIVANGQLDYALTLHNAASDQVCTDRPRHRIGPPVQPLFEDSGI